MANKPSRPRKTAREIEVGPALPEDVEEQEDTEDDGEEIDVDEVVPPKKKAAIYRPVMEAVFARNYKDGASEVHFTRPQIEEEAERLNVDPKNAGDVVYTFRYRRALPPTIKDKAPKGTVWIIRGAGDAKYKFAAVDPTYAFIKPRSGTAVTRIPDSTPGLITKYRLNDEQALLAMIRYNRLLDIFLGVASYSLQSHLRTKLKEVGQLETDEVYVGVDRHGAHYVFPVQAKGGRDKHSIVQIEQDIGMCAAKFPDCICRPIAAQVIQERVVDGETRIEKIAMFSFGIGKDGNAEYMDERHYQLVPPHEITAGDIEAYRKLTLSTAS